MSVENIIDLLEQLFIVKDTQSREEENQRDLDSGFTFTQIHIAAIIQRYPQVNNRLLTDKLHLSRAAISKAMKRLVDEVYVESYQEEDNRKAIFYRLTVKGETLAQMHDQRHNASAERYRTQFKNYDEAKIKTIETFLQDLLALYDEE